MAVAARPDSGSGSGFTPPGLPGFVGTAGPSDIRRRRVPPDAPGLVLPRDDGPPVSRRWPSPRAASPSPANRVDRTVVAASTRSGLPAFEAGRRSPQSFGDSRSSLSCCPWVRWPGPAGLSSGRLRAGRCRSPGWPAPVATGAYHQLPGRNFHPPVVDTFTAHSAGIPRTAGAPDEGRHRLWVDRSRPDMHVERTA